ncbi:MAG: inositol monophosphatase family protein [Microgenomates group bacterium]
MSEYSQFRKFGEGLVVDAGKIVLHERDSLVVVKQKDIQDIATSADLASEKHIIARIKEKYPDHSILSEEEGEIAGSSEYRWIVDPLDGTKEFSRGLPFYNISIALEHKGELIAAALCRPEEDVVYSSCRGDGSFRNGERITPSTTQSLSDSFVYFYVPSYLRSPKRYDAAFEKIAELGKHVYRLRGLSDENSGMCWVAQGGADAYINLSDTPKWHDIATGIMIAKEAGAVVDTEKHPLIVCANKSIYNQLSEII